MKTAKKILNIIDVIPLVRSKFADTLTYFTTTEVPVGAIVAVPLRSKSIHAIVVNSRPAIDLKTEIKNAPYEIRKLGKVKTTSFFPATFMDACKTLADYYATNIGSVIDSLVSDVLMENANKIPVPIHQARFFHNIEPSTIIDETFAVQGDDDDRLGSWRSLIRQEFARKRSLAIYVPTVEESKNISVLLTKGIEGYIFVLHNRLTKKNIVDIWTQIAEIPHPVVIIATPSFSILPRSDIDTIIIERENSRGWINQKQPYMDMRHALETIARKQKKTLYRSDNMLRVETLFRLDEHEIAQGSPFKWRSISTTKDFLVDMRKNNFKARNSKSETNTNTEIQNPKEEIQTIFTSNSFQTLSPELEELIQKNRDENTHLFILTIRRGLSPITVCSDCETIVSCENCSKPVVLHTSKNSGKNFFMCHICGDRRGAEEICINCGGWRLTPLGIGIERVAEEIQAKFPNVDVFKIDSDTTKTDGQILSAIEKFKAKPGSILLGTEMTIVHLTEKIDHIAVTSLDTLFALPDFRIQEKIMYILIRLRSLTNRSILVQTRKPTEKIFEYGLKGNLSDFYHANLEERKQFSYPPYSNLIKITIEGKKDKIANTMAKVQKNLEPREIEVFPAFTATVRNNSIIHGLLRLPRGGWPNSELTEKLRELPFGIKIKVDPESLL